MNIIRTGILGILLVLALSSILVGMEPMDFMVQGPVCIIFGAFLAVNMMQFQLVANLQQPLRGCAKSVICVVGGAAIVCRHYLSGH